MADVAAGKRFPLQGGDCGMFDTATRRRLSQLKILLQMSLVLVWARACRRPRGGMAGRPKLRSRPTELVGDVEVPGAGATT